MVSTKERRLSAEPQWSDYQLAVFDWLENGTGHCQIEAAAGSGKTTSILGIVNRIPCSRRPTSVLAFNRHVARELKQKLGDRSGLAVSTCHSMGLSVLRRYFGGQPIEVNENKYYKLCKKAIKSFLALRVQYEQDWRNSPELAKEKYPQRLPHIGQGTKESKQLEYEILTLLKHTVRYSQMTLTEPTPDALKGMIEHFSLETPKEPEAIDWVLYSVPLVLMEGEKAAADYLDIGLDDLIWLPNRWELSVPQKSVVLWDEGQDANRAMLGLVLRAVKDGGRLIVVGDRRQAIMGFAGSDANSWSHIYSLIHPTVLPLSICYRCPVSHIGLAKHIVPQIEPRPSAPQGTIQVVSLKDVKGLVQPGDLIICRFTAPLVSLCLQLIIAGEKATVKGHEIGKDLTDFTRRAMLDSKYPTDFHSALSDYCSPKVAFFKEQGEDRKAESLMDKLEAIKACFDVFGLECGTLEQFCTRVEDLFSEDGGQVVLSTIHRAKGDESDRVFLLGSNFLPFLTKADQNWQIQQEWNLTYVALTRAKQDLYFVPLSKKDTPATEFLAHPLGGLRLPKAGELELDGCAADTPDTPAKSQIKELEQRPTVLPLELVGHRVFVKAGTYRSEGEGIVEADRGAGTLRMLEVRMSDGKIQVVSIGNIQLIKG